MADTLDFTTLLSRSSGLTMLNYESTVPLITAACLRKDGEIPLGLVLSPSSSQDTHGSNKFLECQSKCVYMAASVLQMIHSGIA